MLRLIALVQEFHTFIHTQIVERYFGRHIVFLSEFDNTHIYKLNLIHNKHHCDFCKITKLINIS